MSEICGKIGEHLSLTGAFIILGFTLWQARPITKNIIEGFGQDSKGKRNIAFRLNFNFYSRDSNNSYCSRST